MSNSRIILIAAVTVMILSGMEVYSFIKNAESINSTYLPSYQQFLRDMEFRERDVVDVDEMDFHLGEDRAQHLPIIETYYVITVKGNLKDIIRNHVEPAGWQRIDQSLPMQFVQGHRGLLYYMLAEQDGNEVRLTIHHEKFEKD